MAKQFTKTDSLIAKGIAILLLLFYHLFHDIRMIDELSVNHTPIPQEGFLTLAGFGNICVAIFVMLTAYGIAKSILDTPDMTLMEAYRQAGSRFWKLVLNFAILYFSVILIWWNRFNLVSLYGSGKQGFLLLLCDALGIAHFIETPTLNETWWYMPLAYTLIFLIPVLVFCVKKVGNMLLLIGFFVPMVITLNSDMQRYFFVAVMGVCVAWSNGFHKIANYALHPVLKWVIGILGFTLCILIRQNAVIRDYFLDYMDAPIAFFMICFSFMLPGTIPFVKQFLMFLGKHSMYIFLVHTFFYKILFRDFIYQFHHAGITYILLLIHSLAYAIVLYYISIFIRNSIRKGLFSKWQK